MGALSLALNGADFSSLAVLEQQGIHYTDNGATKPFETILASHGFNLARIRVWTAGDYTTDYALALAKRAKSAGMKILIDLHYSDTCESILPFTIPKLTLGRGGPWQASDAVLLALGPRFSQPLHL